MNYHSNGVRWGIKVDCVDSTSNQIGTCEYFWVGYTPEQTEKLKIGEQLDRKKTEQACYTELSISEDIKNI